VLGVTIRDDLKAVSHVTETLASCERTLYALRVMRAHGMKQKHVQTVFSATAIAKLTNSASSWIGYTSAAGS